MKKALFLMLFWGMLPGLAQAGSLEMLLNDSSAQVVLTQPLSRDVYGTTGISGRFLFNDREDTTLGSAAFHFSGEPGNVQGLSLGVGAHLYGGQADHNQDLVAVAVGGQLLYAPARLNGLGFAARTRYAPNILSWADAERFVETGLSLSYAVTPRVSLVADYQNIRARIEERGNWTLDDALRLGFQARF